MAVPVPETLDAMLSPAWLTAALQERCPGIEVTAVTDVNEMTRVATNVLFRIECAGGVPPQLSPHLCAKGYFGEVGRLARRASEPEACFYRDLASSIGLRTLRSVYADFDPTAGLGVVITEDVAVGGAVFLDALSNYTPDQTAASLEQLANLHGATWEDASLANIPWLASRLETFRHERAFDQMSANFGGPIGAHVPEAVRDPRRLFEAHRWLEVEARTASPWCVVHGDAHVGNVFLEADGQPSFLDWQLVQRGPWYLDVGYHIASALPVEERRRVEEDLLRHYLGALAAAGVEAPGWDEARRNFRRGMLHGFFLWGITQKVKPAITTVALERMGSAVDDHKVFDEAGA